ncbi:MAG: acetyl-CoA carboxylase biotin carboxyl carrier protein subunit [Clostridia bacterium]|nr:acetyl-CoA carboxylase biotin carboxyl carrier protein subunit [Clostridia bacterium]
MRRFRVNVNGNEYDITVEEIDASAAKSAPAPKAAPKSAAPAGGEAVKSPMPGTILKVNVTNGAAVKKGQVLMILEAMKMENEIMCPCDGKITSLTVAQGASVESGAVLCTIG